MISFHFQCKPFNITVIWVYAPTTNAEETEAEQLYEDLGDLIELTLRKDVLFIIGYWNAKVGSQDIPGERGKFGLGVQNEAGQRITISPRECTARNKYPLPTQGTTLHMDITRWSMPLSDWLSSLQPKMEKLYTDSKNKTRSWLWFRSWTLYFKIQINLKKVGKTTSPFRYDLNQIRMIIQWKWLIDSND